MPLIKNTNTLMADNGGNGTNKASTGTFGPSVFKLNEVRQNINRINNILAVLLNQQTLPLAHLKCNPMIQY